MGQVIIAVHHAGGSARAFLPLQRALGTDVRVGALDLPGRGRRGRQPHFGTIERAALYVAESVDGAEATVLLGVSMGALIAYRAVQILEADGRRPERLIVASANSPQCIAERANDELASFAALPTVGNPHGAADRAVLLADLASVVAHQPVATKVSIPIDVWRGRHDSTIRTRSTADWIGLAPEGLQGSVHTFDGKHLFLADCVQAAAAAEILRRMHDVRPF